MIHPGKSAYAPSSLPLLNQDSSPKPRPRGSLQWIPPTQEITENSQYIALQYRWRSSESDLRSRSKMPPSVIQVLSTSDSSPRRRTAPSRRARRWVRRHSRRRGCRSRLACSEFVRGVLDRRLRASAGSPPRFICLQARHKRSTSTNPRPIQTTRLIPPRAENLILLRVTGAQRCGPIGVQSAPSASPRSSSTGNLTSGPTARFIVGIPSSALTSRSERWLSDTEATPR